MLDVFGPVRSFLELDPVRIESHWFHLYTKTTTVILITLSLLVTCGQYIGDPIDCMVHDIPPPVIDTYCWIHSTFTVPGKFQNVGVQIPHPGVAPYTHEDETKQHKYYQWMCFFLFFQALVFYLPRYIWHGMEGGLMGHLCGGLRVVVIEREAREERKDLVVTYFKNNTGFHRRYAFKYLLCEILCGLNVILQLFFINYFLDGEFMTYGAEVVRFSQMETQDRMDPLSRVFPKVTKCNFNKYGPTGTIQRYDALCVLPLNIVNEKIIIFVWFWYVILCALFVVIIFYRALLIISSKFRATHLKLKCVTKGRNDVDIVSDFCCYGDWFVMALMSVNMDSGVFSEIISDLAKVLPLRGASDEEGQGMLEKESTTEKRS